MKLNAICESADIGEVSAIVVMRGHTSGVQVLLTNRMRAPGVGEWDIVGGHLQYGETKEEAAHRELKEETGIDSYDMEYVREGRLIPGRCLKLYLFSLVVPNDTEVDVGSESDSRERKWFPITNLPTLAFGQNKVVLEIVASVLGEGIVPCRRVLTESKGKGLLIVFEGVDGAGKSTQVSALEKAMTEWGHKPVMTAWNSSKLIHPSIKKLKDAREMYPIIFSLMHAADLWHRYLTIIEPALQEGKSVIADRYYHTSYARDHLRGIEYSFIDDMYKKMPEPDIVFHCSISPEEAVARVEDRKDASYYGDGMDLELAKNPKDNHRIYTKLLSREYDKVLPKAKGYVKIDMARDIEPISREIIAYVKKKIAGLR